LVEVINVEVFFGFKTARFYRVIEPALPAPRQTASTCRAEIG